jgi:hypothetical protein
VTCRYSPSLPLIALAVSRSGWRGRRKYNVNVRLLLIQRQRLYVHVVVAWAGRAAGRDGRRF